MAQLAASAALVNQPHCIFSPAAAPVNRGFARNCTAQQEEDDEIECEGEAFAAVQCKRRHCFCVDMETGLQLSGSRRFQRDEEFNCTQGTYESEIKFYSEIHTLSLFRVAVPSVRYCLPQWLRARQRQLRYLQVQA